MRTKVKILTYKKSTCGSKRRYSTTKNELINFHLFKGDAMGD